VEGISEDHPVHKIPLKKQEKMRAKGINPVLKARDGCGNQRTERVLD
jgi:hypothetical protein